ncbi:DNA mismatch repair protein MutL [Neocallimastix sp. 'constans']|jgi:DNA mismatch repair protein MLH1
MSESNKSAEPKKKRNILKLDETVINRIAAGEVIQRPANALKELMENSLDAGATNIQITVKDGGLKLLQIQDNGSGIAKDDLDIICERFTTSKLKEFNDLYSINTFGFRGEALASISHVARVTITTKTADDTCAYRAYYIDGKLKAPRPGMSSEPRPCAGNKGTQITAEDLFYNVATRRKALKSPGEEYNRILDIVTRYAIHFSGISFSCKKQGSNTTDIYTSSSSTHVDNIRQIYGLQISRELIKIDYTAENHDYKASGYITNANYNTKKMIFLLFINHRAVECSSLKKAIINLYSSYLPKGTHPFVYLSLEINPNNVDVNVHPTKREVNFLNEEIIVDHICEQMQNYLANANASRTFFTQSLLTQDTSFEKENKQKKNKRVYDRDLVRTDSKSQSIDVFLAKPSNINNSNDDNDNNNNNNNNNNISIISDHHQHNNTNNKIRNITDISTLKSRFSSPSNSSTQSSSRVEIFDINKSNLKSSFNRNNDDILEDSSNIFSSNKLKSKINDRRKQIDDDDENSIDGDDDLMTIKKPSKTQSKITNIEIFDTNNTGSSLKRLSGSTSNDDYKSTNLLNNNSNKRVKYGNDQEETTTIKNPVFITSIEMNEEDEDINDDLSLSQKNEMNKYEEDFKIIQNNSREWNDVKLTSVLNLREMVDKNDNKGISNFFHNHTFVGCVDETLALIQYQTKLYLVNYQETSRELFYQLVLRQFSNFGFINLTQKLPIYDLLMISLEAEEEENGWDESLQSKEEIAKNITELLIEKREMLLEYFSITLDDKGHLETLPIILKGYIPNMDKLPGFLLRLGIECNWEEEQECFRTVSQEIAIFYSTEAPIIDHPENSDSKDNNNTTTTTTTNNNNNNNNNMDKQENEDEDENKSVNNSLIIDETEKDPAMAQFYWNIQHVIFPAFKKESFKGCNRLVDERYIMEIANLHDLYRIFERC